MLWQILNWAKSGFVHQKMVMLYTSACSFIPVPSPGFRCLRSPSAPVGRDQRGEKCLGRLLGRRVGVRNSDEKGGQEMGKGFIRHASCVSSAVWRSLWFIPVSDNHSLNQDNQPNRLSSPYHTCQTCSCGQEDQGWGASHQQDNTWMGWIEHPGTTLSVPLPGPPALASTTSYQKESLLQCIKDREHSFSFKWRLYLWTCKG